jgi:hypothetical protein
MVHKKAKKSPRSASKMLRSKKKATGSTLTRRKKAGKRKVMARAR